MPPPDPLLDAFLLGTVDASAVQQWVYEDDARATLLGSDLHHELVNLDYATAGAAVYARRLLTTWHSEQWPGRLARLQAGAAARALLHDGAALDDTVRVLTALGHPIDWLPAPLVEASSDPAAHRAALFENARTLLDALEVENIVEELDLAPHPEGGFYRETYRAKATIDVDGRTRSVSTTILYLLRAGDFSALHRIRSDEGWHFHRGSALEVISFDEDGVLHIDRVDARAPQCVVPAGRWFGARVVVGGAWSLVGCTVSPGFDFADLELADGAALSTKLPNHAALIATLTR